MTIYYKESIYKDYMPAVTADSGDGGGCYWFAFFQTKLLVKHSEASIPFLKSLTELGIHPARTQYLGTLKGRPCYSAELPVECAVPDGVSLEELRSLYGVLGDDIYLLAGRAIQIVNWDRTSQYCGRCGQKTESLTGEMARKCPACGFIKYPTISPVAITAVLKGDKILLSHNATFRGNMHSIIAGFVEPGETLEECVRREVLEEVGLRVKNIRYFASQPWPFPHSLMIGFTAEYESGEIQVDGKEISKAGWYDAHNMPELPGKMSIARAMIDWFIQGRGGDG